MPRLSTHRIVVDSSVQCQFIYPAFGGVEHTDCPARHSARWHGDTIGFSLSKEQATTLAKLLLIASTEQQWDIIDVTAFRTKRSRVDGSYQVTVTARVSRLARRVSQMGRLRRTRARITGMDA
jgi:hypothetical protein